MTGWDAFNQGFAAGAGYVLGAALMAALVLYLAWSLTLGTLSVWRALEDRAAIRRKAREARAEAAVKAAGRERWSAHVDTDPSYVVVKLRDTTRDGLRGYAISVRESELAKIPVGGTDVAAKRAAVASAYAEARGLAAFLNDPTGPDEVLTDTEALLMGYLPPPGYVVGAVPRVIRDGWVPPTVGAPPVEAL